MTSLSFFFVRLTRGLSVFIDLLKREFSFFFFFQLCNAACRISVPRPGIESRPWQWRPRILTPRLMRNSPLWFSLLFFCFQFHWFLLISFLLLLFGFNLLCFSRSLFFLSFWSASLEYWFEAFPLFWSVQSVL